MCETCVVVLRRRRMVATTREIESNFSVIPAGQIKNPLWKSFS
jgi:hypothetical protein